MNDVDFLPISNSDYCLFVSKIKKNRYPVKRDPKVGKNCEGEKRRSNNEEKAKVDWEKCAAATTTSYVHWSHELSATTETGTATQLASNTFTTK